MPCCSAVNCSARSEKGVRLFALPRGVKNKERTKQWILNLKRTKLPDTVYVCEKHFTQDQFENRRADNKRPLRWNAIPTIFSYKNDKEKKKRKPPIIRGSPQMEIISLNDNDPLEVDNLLNQESSENRATASFQAEMHPCVLELQQKLHLAQSKLRQLIKETEILHQQIKTVFNEDQIRFLKRGRMEGHQWQIKTIKESLKLYISCGSTGYEELRKQGYPLPPIVALQKKHSSEINSSESTKCDNGSGGIANVINIV